MKPVSEKQEKFLNKGFIYTIIVLSIIQVVTIIINI